MSYEQLLHDFVDGSLDYQGEMTLFAELQSNEGLRRELKMLMLMQKAAQHDVRAFTPAPESHEAIFARLGFSPGLIEEQMARESQAASGGGLGAGFVGGIIGALMMGMLTLLSGHWMPGDADATRSRPGTLAETTSSRRTTGREMKGDAATYGMAGPAASMRKSPDGTTPQALAAGSSMGGEATGTASGREGGRRTRRIGASSSERHDPTSDIAPSLGADRAIASATILPRAGSARLLRAAPDITAPHAATSSGDHAPLARIGLPATSLPEGEARPSIGVRGIIGRGFETTPQALIPRSNGLLLDRALSAGYELDEHHRIGVEIGQESFYQRFTEPLPTGDLLQHEQAPVLLWGGVSFTRIFGDGPGVRPFIGGFAGGTRQGPLGRLSIGTECELGSGVRLMAAGEIEALAYSFNSSWLLSPKYGFTYGLSMRF